MLSSSWLGLSKPFLAVSFAPDKNALLSRFARVIFYFIHLFAYKITNFCGYRP